ncbi:cilia- and flagella-associated protein 73 isoform X2 [Falco rusticolus]|uniref:cilia- and flagella-associated protein 73 isoform X2 n=1 Tax=Falco rusticolus TaxID=120794 RepID=UPI0018866D58|nr:cilia- and flagella-associated protein 73 isoform X2 [Falco rusticolus]
MVSSKAGVSNLGASRDSPGWSLTTPACVGEQARLPCRALASSGGPWGVLVTPQQWVLPPGRSPPDHGELRATCGRMVPAWDGATLLPSTRLLLKRREVAEVERALQSQREAFQQRMERLAQRWQQLSQREEQFRDVVLEFDEVLKASAARQERLLRRADEERAQAAGQGAKATRLRRELAGLLRRRERLAQRLRSLRGFGEYLQGVLPSMGQPLSPLPLPSSRTSQTCWPISGHWRGCGQPWHNGQEPGGSSWPSTGHSSAGTARRPAASSSAPTESCWAHIQSTAAQKTLLLGQVKLAVLHLFQLATARLSIGTDVALEDTEAQLDMVLLCMQDLAAICAELHPGQPAPRPHLPAAPRMP